MQPHTRKLLPNGCSDNGEAETEGRRECRGEFSEETDSRWQRRKGRGNTSGKAERRARARAGAGLGLALCTVLTDRTAEPHPRRGRAAGDKPGDCSLEGKWTQSTVQLLRPKDIAFVFVLLSWPRSGRDEEVKLSKTSRQCRASLSFL